MKKYLLLIFLVLVSPVFADYDSGLGGGTAATTTTDVTYFNGTLSGTDDTVQKALETLDDAIAGAGSGDVTGVGDCTDGACLDGTSDGGTWIKFYDAQGAGQLINGNLTAIRTWTMPDATGTVALTTSNVSTATALAANGANCDAGSAPLGVDASGAAEGCFAVLTAETGDISAVGSCTTGDCDVLKDLVTTSPLTGGVDDILLGADSDVTIAINWDSINNITADNMNWSTMTDLTTGGAVVWGNIAEGELANSTVITDDIKDGTITAADTAITAGRSLTWSTNDLVADEETYTYKSGYGAFDPVDTDDIAEVDYFDKAVTLTRFRCYSDQTVIVQLQRNDGSATNMFTENVTCDSGGGSACASGCDTTFISGEGSMAATNTLKLVTVSVANTPTVVTMKWFGTYDD